MNLESFFFLMYKDRPEGSHILVWRPTEKGGTSLWTPDLSTAVNHIRKQKGDIYFQVGLAGQKYKRTQRCSLQEKDDRPVISLPAVFADIDYQHPCHKKQDLPPNLKSAMALVHGNGFDPTVTIHSGHGIQCYWIFKEPWLTDTAEERRDAQKLLTRLKQRLQNDARDRGWSVDSVQDLVRVLRPPESLNCKQGNPIRVEVIKANENRRYNPDDFDEFLPPYDPSAGPRTEKYNPLMAKIRQEIIQSLKFDPRAEPPEGKFKALKEFGGIDFTDAWDNTKKIKDRSASGYDLSLATQAIEAYWSDQEVVDLLIAHRRHNRHDLKLKNKQYYARTLITAKFRADRNYTLNTEVADNYRAIKKHQALVDRFEIKTEDTPVEIKRKKLSVMFRVEILKIERYVTQNPVWKIYTEKGEIKVPGLDTHGKVRNRFVNVLKVVPDKSIKKKWDEVSQMMLDICEDVTVAPEATDPGEMIALLREYLEGQGENTLEESTERWSPFIKNRHWHIYPAKFRDWVTKAVPGIFKNSQEMYTRLREAGCERKDMNVYVDERRTKKTTWRVPRKIIKPESMNETELKEQYSGHSMLNADFPPPEPHVSDTQPNAQDAQ